MWTIPQDPVNQYTCSSLKRPKEETVIADKLKATQGNDVIIKFDFL